MATVFSQKNAKFSCDICCFDSNNKYDYSKHLLTAKHSKATQCNDKTQKEASSDKLICCCGKKYADRVGLWRHKKNCIFQKDSENNISDTSSNLILELIKQNQDFQKQILDLVKENGLCGNTINSHNTNSNNFNLNFFLNEKCKDAMNISDFIKSLEISFEDFENVGTLGYAEGISKIIINNLKNTEVEKRPMHCSDLKRETMYIKDKDIWENDKEKTLFISAIKGVAHKNFMRSFDWKKENPDYSDSSSKTMDKYTKILYENSGPQTTEEREKEYNKILRRVAREVMINK